MIRPLILLFIFLLQTASLNAQDSVVLRKSEAVLANITNISYNISGYHLINGKDTNARVNYKVYFQRKQDDNQLGFRYRIEFAGGAYFYNGKEFCFTWHADSSVEVYRENIRYHFDTHFPDEVILSFLWEPHIMGEYFHSEHYFATASYKAEQGYHIKSPRPDFMSMALNSKITYVNHELWINGETMFPAMYRIYSSLNDMRRLMHYDITYSAVNVPIHDSLFGPLGVEQQFPHYLFDYVRPGKQHALDSGDLFPAFSYVSENGDSLKFSIETGQVTIINFWFEGCIPCNNSVSLLSSLHRRYSDSGLFILSLNPVETDPRELESYIWMHNPSYPTGLIRKETVRDLFGIRFYPTFLIVDNKGVVRSSFRGYYDSTAPAIQNLIRELIPAP